MEIDDIEIDTHFGDEMAEITLFGRGISILLSFDEAKQLRDKLIEALSV